MASFITYPHPNNKNPLKHDKNFLSKLSLMKNQIKIVSNQNSHTASFIMHYHWSPYAIIGTTMVIFWYENIMNLNYLHQIKQIASLVYIAKILSSKKETGLIFYTQRKACSVAMQILFVKCMQLNFCL